MKFEWDENKNEANIKKRKINFNNASQVFYDNDAISFEDNSQTYGDGQRMRIIGQCPSLQNILFVVYVEIEDDYMRIISARKAEPHERKLYRQNVKRR